MDKFSVFLVLIVAISSYITALVSALFVLPQLWIPIGIIYLLLGLYWLYRYTYKNRGVVAISVFTNGTMISFGQYLESYLPAASIPVNLLGVAISFLMMLVWYYFKEGKRHVEVRVKQEKVVEQEKQTAGNVIKALFIIIKRQRQIQKERGYTPLLSLQFAYVEMQEEKLNAQKKNAIDFVLGKEVQLQRNEYDQSPK